MIIPMPTEGNEDAASITSYRSATYGVATEGSIIKAICS
jgi:hypothetical protein